ncbi:hypothetical protein M758_UG039800 [Ceratodon purpureus]|nr:hypothetical protein M758_UG039800 [Ceratodon purpureus]
MSLNYFLLILIFSCRSISTLLIVFRRWSFTYIIEAELLSADSNLQLQKHLSAKDHPYHKKEFVTPGLNWWCALDGWSSCALLE